MTATGQPREWGQIREREGRFYVRFTAEGRKFERGPFPTEAKARKARDKARLLLEDRAPVADVLANVFGDFDGSRLTFRAAAAKYLEAVKAEKKATTYETDVYRLRTAVGAPWAGKLLARVEPADLIAWRASRRKATERMRLRKRRDGESAAEFAVAEDRKVKMPGPGASVATLNRDLAIVSAVFEWARKLRYVATNPAREVEGYSEKGRERTIYLTSDESRALVAAATGPVRAFLLALLHTGMRRGELLALRWRSVDLERREVYIEAATEKAGRGRTVPMTGPLHAVLDGMKKRRPAPAVDESDLVFMVTAEEALTVGDVRCGFEAAVRGAALPRAKADLLCLHSLRHTAASLMVAAGVPLFDVAKILGHSTIAVTMKYAHFAPKAGRAAIDALGAALSGTAAAPKAGGNPAVSGDTEGMAAKSNAQASA